MDTAIQYFIFLQIIYYNFCSSFLDLLKTHNDQVEMLNMETIKDEVMFLNMNPPMTIHIQIILGLEETKRRMFTVFLEF